MRRAKIVLFDSGVFRYQYQKFPEASLAGALIISDLPLQDEDFWREVIVPVSSADTDSTLVDTINWWLAHDEEREAKALHGQLLVAQKYTCDHTIDKLLQGYRRYKEERYGLWFPYPFTYGCMATNNSGGRNPFCTRAL